MKLLRNSVYLKIPTLTELSFTQELLSCEQTMAFNKKWGGTVDFPEEKWTSFYKNYIENPTRFYFHIYNLDHLPVGEVSTRYDDELNGYCLNIKVLHKYRGNNHAFDALDVFLDYLFNEVGIERIVDNVASDNLGAIKLLEKIGFKTLESDENITLMGLDKNTWL